MNLRFFYKNNKPSNERETLITSLTEAIANVISLPPIIDVCLYDLGENVYGGIDRYKINKIGINYELSYDEIPMILTHELIHVHQSYTNKLRLDRNGNFYWHGILYTNKQVSDMTYEEYTNLPWEIDVERNQSKILSSALATLDK